MKASSVVIVSFILMILINDSAINYCKEKSDADQSQGLKV